MSAAGSSHAGAWLLRLPGRLHAAVGERELVHIIPQTPTLYEIPGAPEHCRHALVWQGEILPLMDVGARLRGAHGQDQTMTLAGIAVLVGVVAYPDPVGGEVRHAGLRLARVPVRVSVSDAQACRLPHEGPDWTRLAISCFAQPGLGPVPILDLSRLFGAPVRDRDTRH
jgi:chemotaxis signal transduction protein